MSGFSVNDGLGDVRFTGEPAAAPVQADTTLIRLDKFRADPRFAGIDGGNQTVVVIDTGIDLDHPFFGADNGNGVSSRIVASYDFSGEDDPDATDWNGHGSNVASIVGSSDATYTGMAPGCNIIALKVFTDAGGASAVDIAEALDWVAANREAYNIVSVNMSLGYGDNRSAQTPSPFASQIADLHDNGCAVVVASGNSYYNYQRAGVSTPSADPNAWSVGAVWDRDVGAAYWYSGAIDYVTGADHITSFSQRGPGVTTILAPGGAITGANWNGGTVTESGTSQAAPHIAGLVADMQQLAQLVSGHAMSVDDLRDTMVTSGVKIYDGNNGYDNEVHTYGMYARVDALAWGTSILNKLFAGTSGDDTLNGTAVNDVIHGGAGNDALYGGGGNDTLHGDAGDDILDGGAGANTLYGGSGDDTYIVNSAADKAVELYGQGNDTVLTALAGYTLAANVENLTYTGAGNFRGTGNNLNNAITGGSGADVLDGGAGADTLTGGEGDDVYIADNAGDVVIEDYWGGTDTVRTSLSTYTLGHEVENLTYTGFGNFRGIGNELDNIITGGAGADILDGGEGEDTLTGGAGNDVYVVDNVFDMVSESAGGGIDTVCMSLNDCVLAANIENLTFTGKGDFTGIGNELANVITGRAGGDFLDGGEGADTLTGGAGNDTYVVDNKGDRVVEAAGQGTDTVVSTLSSYTLGANLENLIYLGDGNFRGTGNSLNNEITGGWGADILDGGAGADTLRGGEGDDIYIVDNAGDGVIERAGQGIDMVRASLAVYALGANVENLIYTGRSNFRGTGNELANVITGGAGNDFLDGGAGADTMTGGAGNDTYVADNAGDKVIEAAGGGTDTVLTTLASYALSASVENLTYTGAANFYGLGNSLNNVLTGGAGSDILEGGVGNDTLDGGAGADTLIGGTGNDLYIADDAGDTIVELAGGGIDTVRASAGQYVLSANVENLIYTVSDNFQGTGNALANVITGGAGNDFLDGGAGADTLTGGAGNDTYVIDNIGDRIVEYANGGTDTVLTTLTRYALGANLDNLTYTGTGNFAGTGNGLANVITGGGGNDWLTGGGGPDTFVFTGHFGNDAVTDFTVSAAYHDVLQFDQTDFADFDALLAACTQVGSSVVIALDEDNTVTLQRMTKAAIEANAADFHFV